jgi:hypothetical protein
MDEIRINRSKPINIKPNTKVEQYSLNNMRFDPTQNSPPSLWKTRLNKRVGESPIKYSQTQMQMQAQANAQLQPRIKPLRV